MTNLHLALLYGFFTFVGIGISTALTKPLIEKLGVAATIFIRTALTTFIYGIYIIVAKPIIIFDVKWILIMIAVASYTTFGYFLLVKAFAVGKISIVNTISSSRIIISIIIASIFLNDPLINSDSSLGQILLIIVIIVGIIGMVYNKNDIKNSKWSNVAGLNYAILNALIWGSGFVFFGIISDHIGPIFVAIIGEIVTSVLLLVKYIVDKSEKRIDIKMLKSSLILLLTSSIFAAIGILSHNYGLQTKYVTLSTIFDSATPIFTLIYGSLILKEKLTNQQIICSLLVIIGIIGLSVL